jgi:DNA-binding response OmpR family regulator
MQNHKAIGTVLLVEDEPLLRMIAADIAEEAGYAVLQASNADAAFEMIKARTDVGILVTDVHMPGSMDGFSLARAVRERWPRVELIITSGRLRPTPAELPDDGLFVPKPYNSSQLLAALETVARRGGPVSQAASSHG